MILQQCGGAFLATLTAILITAGPTAMNAQTTLASYSDFAHLPKSGGLPAGWTTWTPRAEISPKFSVDESAGRTGKGALLIDGAGNPAAVGAWRLRVADIHGGSRYRLSAYYRA